MSLIWHLIKSNIIFNKFRLAFFSAFCLSVSLLVWSYSGEENFNAGSVLIQNGIYMVIIIFTGKLSAGNKLMFGLKNLHALPISKKQLLFSKSVADIVFFLPAASMIAFGAILKMKEFHALFIIVAGFLALFIANLISLKKRIDFSRTQHSNASFKNSILWFHRILETGLAFVVLSFLYANIKIFTGKNIFAQEYMLILLLIFSGFIVFKHTLKLLKDETLSYFFLKRDSIRIGWKLALFLIPVLTFKYIDVDDIDTLKKMKREVASVIHSGKKIVHEDSTNRAIVKGDVQKLLESEKKGYPILWNKPLIGGNYPIHLAVLSNNTKMIDEILSRKKDTLKRKTRYSKLNAAQLALIKCKLNAFEHLIKKGIDQKIKDKRGYPFSVLAAKAKCYGGLVLLKKYGHDLEERIKTKNGDVNAFNFISSQSGMAHILEGKRVPSSVKKQN